MQEYKLIKHIPGEFWKITADSENKFQIFNTRGSSKEKKYVFLPEKIKLKKHYATPI